LFATHDIVGKCAIEFLVDTSAISMILSSDRL